MSGTKPFKDGQQGAMALDCFDSFCLMVSCSAMRFVGPGRFAKRLDKKPRQVVNERIRQIMQGDRT